jgi:hypothetical protein
MNDCATLEQQITAQRVSEAKRLGTLPKHFGQHMLTVEGYVYDLLTRFCEDYTGGIWDFYELSNGGFYMTPPECSYAIRVDSNGFEGTLSADATGITVCLFVFSHLSFECERASDLFARHFHRLRQYAIHHPEARLIFAAID